MIAAKLELIYKVEWEITACKVSLEGKQPDQMVSRDMLIICGWAVCKVSLERKQLDQMVS